MKIRIVCTILYALLSVSSGVTQGADNNPSKVLRVLKKGEGDGEVFIPAQAQNPPVIDGRLDDRIWKKTQKFTDFKTFKPDWGKDPSEETEAYITYDSHNLYIAIRCYDSEPEKIKASVTSRDNIFNEDNALFVMDTFGNRQSAYVFFMNPYGIQGDGIINADGNGDMSVDIVWFSKGIIDNEGYSVEAKIPFKSIRFPNKDRIEVGFAFARTITRKSEELSYPELSPDKGSILSQVATLMISNITYERAIEFLPAITHNQTSSLNEGTMMSDERDNDFSFTTKFGLTSEMTLDGTYNPDFSQVEADAGQVDVNLRYDLFYPEKRSFFLEGKEYFDFAGNSEDSPLRTIVHTRRIVDPLLGLKLTGKLSEKDMISSIIASDESPGMEQDDDGELLYPGERAQFSILRHKHVLREDGYVGVIYTGRDFKNSFNRVVGSDGRFRINPYNVFEYHIMKSYTRELESSGITPGHAAGLRYIYSSRRYVADIGYHDISKNFQTETGYITRTGINRLGAFGMIILYPESDIFQKIEPFYWSYHIRDKFSDMFETFNLFCLRFWMPRKTMMRFDFILANEVFEAQKFDISGFGIQGNSQLTKRVNVNLNFRKSGRIYYDIDDPYQGRGIRLGALVGYQPSDKLSSSLSFTYSDFYRKSNSEKIYDYTILRNRTTFQVNKYLFFRGIAEYNNYRKELTCDFLASFTYIPGTVFHIGYGSIFRKIRWEDDEYVNSRDFMTTKRGFFIKTSYLWRM